MSPTPAQSFVNDGGGLAVCSLVQPTSQATCSRRAKASIASSVAPSGSFMAISTSAATTSTWSSSLVGCCCGTDAAATCAGGAGGKPTGNPSAAWVGGAAYCPLFVEPTPAAGSTFPGYAHCSPQSSSTRSSVAPCGRHARVVNS